jgi:hypothetical protein
MSKQMLRTFWILALFGTGVIAGCSGQTSAPPNPTVVSTTPARGATNVQLAQVISATFDKAMNHATITTTFWLTAPGAIAVAGTVTSNGTTSSFPPTLPLAPGTLYTATISTGVQDTSGNALRGNAVWTCTTGTILTITSTSPTTNAATVPLNQKVAATYNQAMNPATLTATGTFTVAIAGGGLAVPGTVTYEATANTVLFTPTANLAPSTHYTASIAPTLQSASGTFLITGGDLTLDAQGDTNAVWVFQTAISLTVGDAGVRRNVLLINGAQAKNVFWQVGSVATINPAGGGTMVGTIIACMGVAFSTPGIAAITTLNGRALALNASVTMVNTVINVPAP